MTLLNNPSIRKYRKHRLYQGKTEAEIALEAQHKMEDEAKAKAKKGERWEKIKACCSKTFCNRQSKDYAVLNGEQHEKDEMEMGIVQGANSSGNGYGAVMEGKPVEGKEVK